MASITSKNNQMFKYSLLAIFLGSAGCAAFPQSVPPEQAKDAAIGKSTAKSTARTEISSGETATGLITTEVQGDQLLDTHLHADLWGRIRAGYAMPVLNDPLVARHEQWFINNPEYLDSMMGRARLYLYYIVDEVEKRGMPMEIALLPAIESAYKPQAYSRARASGPLAIHSFHRPYLWPGDELVVRRAQRRDGLHWCRTRLSRKALWAVRRLAAGAGGVQLW